MLEIGARRSLLGALRALGVRRFTRYGGDAILTSEAATVLLVEPGDDPERNGVRRADHVTLFAPDLPLRVLEDRTLPVYVLLRVGREAIHLGRAQLTSYGGRRREASFQIVPPLPRQLLLLARPPRAPAPRPSRHWSAQVESDRIAAMLHFLDAWHGPLAEQDGVRDDELARVPIPDALAALYRRAGRCPRVLAAQNRITHFDEWRSMLGKPGREGRTPVYVENQGVFVASALATDPDPDVFVEHLGPDPIRSHERLSGFLLQALIFEAIMGAPFFASAMAATSSARDAVVAPLSRLPLGPVAWLGEAGEQWCGDGVLAFTCANGDGWDVMVGARDRAVLEWLLSVDIDWDSLDA